MKVFSIKWDFWPKRQLIRSKKENRMNGQLTKRDKHVRRRFFAFGILALFMTWLFIVAMNNVWGFQEYPESVHGALLYLGLASCVVGAAAVWRFNKIKTGLFFGFYGLILIVSSTPLHSVLQM